MITLRDALFGCDKAATLSFLRLDPGSLTRTNPPAWRDFFFAPRLGFQTRGTSVEEFVNFYYWLQTQNPAVSWEALSAQDKILAAEHNLAFVVWINESGQDTTQWSFKRSWKTDELYFTFAEPTLAMMHKYGTVELLVNTLRWSPCVNSWTPPYLHILRDRSSTLAWIIRVVETVSIVPNAAFARFIFVYGTIALCRRYMAAFPGMVTVENTYEVASRPVRMFWSRHALKRGWGVRQNHITLAYRYCRGDQLDWIDMAYIRDYFREFDTDSFAWSLFVLIGLVQEMPTPEEPEVWRALPGTDLAHFLAIATELPLEVQMIVCGAAYSELTGVLQENITATQIETGRIAW